MYEPDKKLKTEMREAGVTAREVANFLNEPPGTTTGRLNGWIPLSWTVRKRIVEYIESVKQQKAAA